MHGYRRSKGREDRGKGKTKRAAWPLNFVQLCDLLPECSQKMLLISQEETAILWRSR